MAQDLLFTFFGNFSKKQYFYMWKYIWIVDIIQFSANKKSFGYIQ